MFGVCSEANHSIAVLLLCSGRWAQQKRESPQERKALVTGKVRVWRDSEFRRTLDDTQSIKRLSKLSILSLALLQGSTIRLNRLK